MKYKSLAENFLVAKNLDIKVLNDDDLIKLIAVSSDIYIYT